MILAGDIGGTKSSLGIFDEVGQPQLFETYASADYDGLDAIVRQFVEEHGARVERACFGVAGPVHDGRTEKVNLAWPVDARELRTVLGVERVELVNDLEANAWGIAALAPGDVAVLNEGDPDARGNAAVLSAGTGLGEAGLYWDGERHRVFASEGGHTDFAPTSEEEIELYRFLADEHGHVSYERVCSGMGLVNIHEFLVETGRGSLPGWLRAEMEAGDAAAAIGAAAKARRDSTGAHALGLLVSIYGAKAGNVALSLLATGGVWLGGGVAPKNLEKLQDGTFMRAFVDKGRFRDLLERIPVCVILNDTTALLGAALCAARS